VPPVQDDSLSTVILVQAPRGGPILAALRG